MDSSAARGAANIRLDLITIEQPGLEPADSEAQHGASNGRWVVCERHAPARSRSMRALFRSRRALRRLPPATGHSQSVANGKNKSAAVRARCPPHWMLRRTSRLNAPACFLAAEEARPPRFRAAALPRTPIVAHVPCVATSTKQQQALQPSTGNWLRAHANRTATLSLLGTGGTGGHTLGYSPAQVGASVQRADVQHYLDHLELDRLPCLP